MKGECVGCGALEVAFLTRDILECAKCGDIFKLRLAFRCVGCSEIFSEIAVTSGRGGVRCGPCRAEHESHHRDSRHRARAGE